jgi:retron-type reverse transcriptase
MLLHTLARPTILKKAWTSLKSGKSDDARKSIRGIDGVSIKKFEQILEDNPNIFDDISDQLLKNNYELSELKGFFYRKSNKKDFRLICPPSVTDSIIHSAILTTIKPYFDSQLNNGASYSGVPIKKGRKKTNHITAIKNIHAAFKRGNYFVYESDIKGFFDHINKSILYEKITSNLPDSSLNELIRQVIYFKLGNYADLVKQKRGIVPQEESTVGIAQGSPLSPFFANVYLSDIDSLMMTETGSLFFRYVDDFIILAPKLSEAEDNGKKCEQLLNALGLKIAPNKTSTCYIINRTEFFTFLGLKINRFQVEQKKKVTEIIEILKEDYLKLNHPRYNKIKTKTDLIVRINARIQGYANFYRTFHTVVMLKKVNQLIKSRKNTSKVLNKIEMVDDSGKKQFMSEKQWQSAFPN